jgi:hypothetical protein
MNPKNPHIVAALTAAVLAVAAHSRSAVAEIGFMRYDESGHLVDGYFRLDSADLLRQLGYTVQAPQLQRLSPGGTTDPLPSARDISSRVQGGGSSLRPSAS